LGFNNYEKDFFSYDKQLRHNSKHLYVWVLSWPAIDRVDLGVTRMFSWLKFGALLWNKICRLVIIELLPLPHSTCIRAILYSLPSAVLGVSKNKVSLLQSWLGCLLTGTPSSPSPPVFQQANPG
jgi:hypothetical protein